MNQAKQNYLKSIEFLGEQIKQSYNEAGKLKLPASYGQINKIAVFGMGGSQLGVDLINNLFSQELKVPIIQIRDYSVPKFINDKTLVFLISYSGSTEEVVEISKKFQPKAGRALAEKVVVITVGGELAKVAKKNHWPVYQINPINNPSDQPRMGTGYSIGSLVAILKKLKLINLGKEQIKDLVEAPRNKIQVTNKSQISSFKLQTLKVKAKSLAHKLKNKIPIIVTSEHLQGNAHIMANQINESSKQRCYFFAIPELNHHLLEGLELPKAGRQDLSFVFINSGNYHFRNQRRFKITQEVLRKQKIACREIVFGGTKIEEAFKALSFGGLLSYELSKLNKVDPHSVPWVNYLKRRLRRQ